MNNALIQVVPPGEGGVVDYARCLQAEWARQGRASQWLALSQASARARPLAMQLRALMEQLASPAPRSCALVLHFSGYGYGQRGLCGWLLDELSAARAQFGAALRVVPLFHELFASGPPWRSAFWLSRWQASISARIARQADAVWTNADEHAQWLRAAVRGGVPVHVRPVFSNVGEGDAPDAAADRAPRAVVFGTASTRQRALRGLQRFEAALRQLGVEELVEAGTGAASPLGLGSLPRRHAGRLEPAALSALLQSSRFAVLDYPSSLLAKSGVFAACATHACVVLVTRPPGADVDGLVAGHDYVNLHRLNQRPGSLATPEPQHAMGARLARWYGDHRLAAQARELWALAQG